MRELIKNALHTPITEVYYCDHIMDNTFVRCELWRTEEYLKIKEYIPIGYCKEPEYSPGSGVAFVLKDKDDYTLWVHVPKTIFRGWLTQIGEDWKQHPIWKGIIKE